MNAWAGPAACPALNERTRGLGRPRPCVPPQRRPCSPVGETGERRRLFFVDTSAICCAASGGLRLRGVRPPPCSCIRSCMHCAAIILGLPRYARLVTVKVGATSETEHARTGAQARCSVDPVFRKIHAALGDATALGDAASATPPGAATCTPSSRAAAAQIECSARTRPWLHRESAASLESAMSLYSPTGVTATQPCLTAHESQPGVSSLRRAVPEEGDHGGAQLRSARVCGWLGWAACQCGCTAALAS